VSNPAGPALYQWVAPAGRPPPPLLEEAEAAFAQAMDAYARGERTDAAARFDAAAALVPDTTDERYKTSLETMREIARSNAQLARSAALTTDNRTMAPAVTAGQSTSRTRRPANRPVG
jgi:hypothetical protein